jgi:ribose transport system permease protein
MAMVISILAGCAMGAVNGLLIASLKISSIVVTLCFLLILNGMAIVVTQGYPIYDMPDRFLFIGQGYIGDWIPFSIIIFALAVAIGWFVLHKTYFGRYIYALGGNQDAARLAGISIFKVRIATYVICSFFTAIGAMMLLSRTDTATPTAGASYPFDCLTAVVLGGVSLGGGYGNVITTMVGVVIITLIANALLLMGYDSNFQQIIKGSILLLAVSIDAVQRNQTIKA